MALAGLALPALSTEAALPSRRAPVALRWTGYALPPPVPVGSPLAVRAPLPPSRGTDAATWGGLGVALLTVAVVARWVPTPPGPRRRRRALDDGPSSRGEAV